MAIVSLLYHTLKPGFLLAFGNTKLSRVLWRGMKMMDPGADSMAIVSEGFWRRATLDAIPCNWQFTRHSTFLLFGLCACFSASGVGDCIAYAESIVGIQGNGDVAVVKASHGKPVYTNYSVIGIPGDGRCLFRAIAHGLEVNSGRAAPNESIQRDQADDLRGKVVDELIRRREETEWFIEGDFDTYTKRMRQPHVWGGEPELLMASHVLKMPITVYMFEEQSRGLISIAKYGREYKKGNKSTIRVLYHGFGHYDALKFFD